MPVLFFFLGAFGGFISGLLGIGGAVIMIPLMLGTPTLFGFQPLSMQAISGLSIVQVFFASLSGILVHGKNRLVDRSALLILGSTMAAFSLVGVGLSTVLSSRILLVIFGLLAILAFVLMLLPPPKDRGGEGEAGFNKPLALAIGASVGVLSGMVGAGGGFILIPLMIYLLKIPLKTTVGTSLGIVFIGSIAIVVGKAFSGQIEWLLAAALVLGAVPFARLGAMLSKKLPPAPLRALLVLVILASCVQTWIKVSAAFSR